ncbi:hypothetical protein Tco_0583232 [Tanacetum coccineum]
MIVMTSMVELESLFGHLFDELSNGENQVVSKSSDVTTADAFDKRQQQQDSTSSTSSLATTISADGNFDFQNRRDLPRNTPLDRVEVLVDSGNENGYELRIPVKEISFEFLHGSQTQLHLKGVRYQSPIQDGVTLDDCFVGRGTIMFEDDIEVITKFLKLAACLENALLFLNAFGHVELPPKQTPLGTDKNFQYTDILREG